MCWCWLSFWLGILATCLVALALMAAFMALCYYHAMPVDEHGNPIVKVRDAG